MSVGFTVIQTYELPGAYQYCKLAQKSVKSISVTVVEYHKPTMP